MKKNIRSLYAAILVLLFVPSIVFPQLQKAVRTTKLDPRLQLIVDQARKQPAMQQLNAQSVQSVTSADGKQRFPCFVHSSNMQRLRSDGIPLQTVIGTFATARLTVEELELLENHAAVQFVQPTTIEYPHNDVATALSGADVLHSGNVNSTEYTGSGVIVGIIDTGIDWDHVDFRDPVTPAQSRILCIWDQTLTKTGAEVTPVSYSYGVQYSNAQIEDELDGSPAGFVRESDINGHGTHVAGTAAGNGSSLSTTKYKGMAPEADIIVVKAGDGSFPTTNIVDGISYMDSVAAVLGKPLVINMSLGSDQGPHDGTDAKGIAVENFSGPGRIAVMSAGNSGALPIHFTGSVGASDSSTVTFTVPAYTPAGGASNDYFQFDVWLENGTEVTAKVTTPNGFSATQVSNSAATTQTDDGTIYLYNAINSTNDDREVLCYVYDASFTPATGAWTLKLINTTGSAVTYHGWLYDYTIGTGNSIVTVTGGNNNYTVSNCSDSAIIVGSYASRWSWTSNNGSSFAGGGTDYSDDISSFSSIGPSRTGGQKPDIAAPGQHIVSSLSTDASFDATDIVTGGLHAKSQGTSMSSPVVAGAVALLLQQNPNYSTLQVKSLLTSTVLSDSYTGGSLPDAYWGYGKLDILHAMVKAIDGDFVFARTIPTYDEWGSFAYTDIGSGVKIAAKFTPSITGNITGAMFFPYTTFSLTGPLYAEVWSDNGSGLPSAKIGTTVMADQDAIMKASWNAVNMTGSGASVSSGTDYHLVLYYNTSGTEFSMALDVGSIDNRSSVHNGSSWAAYGSGDFHMRPVIMTDISALPVELIAFSATATELGVMLRWNTATEVNNYGFEIERSLSPTPSQWEGTSQVPLRGVWGAIGFVNGSGTSNAPNSYSFTDKNVKQGKFSYRLQQIDLDGKFSYSNEIEVSFGQLPMKFSLEQNYPNPFNPATEIRYQIAEASHVTLKIFDALGREAATLVNEVKEPGRHTVKFNASSLASGMYFARLQSNGKQLLRKMLLMK